MTSEKIKKIFELCKVLFKSTSSKEISYEIPLENSFVLEIHRNTPGLYAHFTLGSATEYNKFSISGVFNTNRTYEERMHIHKDRAYVYGSCPRLNSRLCVYRGQEMTMLDSNPYYNGDDGEKFQFSLLYDANQISYARIAAELLKVCNENMTVSAHYCNDNEPYDDIIGSLENIIQMGVANATGVVIKSIDQYNEDQ